MIDTQSRNPRIFLWLAVLFIVGAVILSLFALWGKYEMLGEFMGGVLLIIFGLAISLQLFQTWVSPVVFYLVPWGLVLTFHSLFLSNYYLAPLTPRTYLAVFVSSLAFIIGVVMAERRWQSSAPRFIHCLVNNRNGSLSDWDSNKFRKLIWMLFALGFIAALYQTFRVGGITELISAPGKVRFTFWRPESGYFFLLLSFAVPLAVYYMIITRKISWSFLAASTIAFVWMLLPGSRSMAFFAVGQSAMLLLLNKPNLNYRILLLLVVLFFAFTLVGNRRNQGRDISLTFIERGYVQLPIEQKVFVMPYFYLTTPIQNLQQNLEGSPDLSFGRRTFFPVLAWMQLDSPSDQIIQTYNPTFNVGTYLVDYFYDFGWFGIVILPLLIGYVGTFIFLRRCYSSMYFLISALSLYVLAMGVFSNYFNNPDVWLYLFLLLLAEHVCRNDNQGEGLDPCLSSG